MAFEDSTRLRDVPKDTKTKGTSNPLTWTFDKSHILAYIMLAIRGTVTGTIGTPNPLGKASIINNVRLAVNGNNDIFNMSGPQYHYLLRDNLEDFDDVGIYSDARSAVAAGAFILDMLIPVAQNMRDRTGLIPLQNPGMSVTLSVTFEQDLVVATGGAVVAATVTPTLGLFSVPKDPHDWPEFNLIHQCLGETQGIGAVADYPWPFPVGNTFLQALFGYGIGASPADNWSRVQLKASQSDTLYDYTPSAMDMVFARTRQRARPLGVIPLDFMGSNGFGSFAGSRDAIHMEQLPDVKAILTPTATGTLQIVKRQLVALG